MRSVLELPRRWVIALIAAVATVYAAFPPRATVVLVDEIAFQDTLRRMRDGAGYYEATSEAFARLDAALASVTSFRTPFPFLLWRWVPDDLLYPFAVAVVVVVTCALMTRLTVYPVIVLPIAVYLLYVSRGTFEAWLHPELWTLPLLAGSMVAYRRRSFGVAAALACGAFLVRDLAGLLLVGGAIDAIRRRRAIPAWMLAAGVGVTVFATHLVLASRYLHAVGGEAERFGTGDPPRTVLAMAGFRLPLLVGLVIWIVAFPALRRRGELLLAGPLALLPLAGILVNRPYWGILVTPFFLLWALDLACDAWTRRAVKVATG